MKFLSRIAILLLPLFSCNGGPDHFPGTEWHLGEKVLSPDLADSLENTAVKDPSIVFFEGQYHLFYSARSVYNKGDEPGYNICCRYRSATTLAGLADAVPVTIDKLAGCKVIAPQVFFFQPDSLWYLVAHTPSFEGRLDRLTPIYLTNRRIGNPLGWSEAREIRTGKQDAGFRIDFWVICDEDNAHLFFADQTGSLLRLECSLEEFPGGFVNSVPEVALHVNRMNQDPGWRFFEAAHIYYVKEEKVYLAVLEGAWRHPVNTERVDSRNRFVFGMIADSLDGTWRRVKDDHEVFLASADNITDAAGNTVSLTQVSHPELIRSGHDQRLEIDSYNMQMIFQSFDGSQIPDDFHYNELPWELYMMKNYH